MVQPMSDEEREEKKRSNLAALEEFFAATEAEANSPEGIARREREESETAAFLERLTTDFVATAKLVASACPVIVEGLTRDGRHFFYRARSGSARLGFGADDDAAARDPESFHDYGPAVFDAEETYNSFARLAIRSTAPKSSEDEPTDVLIRVPAHVRDRLEEFAAAAGLSLRAYLIRASDQLWETHQKWQELRRKIES